MQDIVAENHFSTASPKGSERKFAVDENPSSLTCSFLAYHKSLLFICEKKPSWSSKQQISNQAVLLTKPHADPPL